MTRLVTVLVVVLTAMVVAAPVPKVKKDQWVISMGDDLYLFTDGDERPTKLTDGKGHYDYPAWSPDGKRIAFCSKKDGYSRICSMDADGKNPMHLGQDKQGDDAPDWSPDGKWIAFCRETGDNRDTCQICVMSSKDGSEVEVVSNSDDFFPVFSPDGKAIAFISQRDGGNGLYLMEANGEKPRRLVSEPTSIPSFGHAWSPDGKQIAFTLRKDKGLELHTVNTDGTGVTLLTQFGEDKIARSPSWSPNGKRVSFLLEDTAKGTTNPCSLWTMDANGENQKEVLKLGKEATRPHTRSLWRPK